MVLKVSHTQLNEVLKNYYEKKLALFIWGTFGIGKSRVVLQSAREVAESKGKIFVEWNKIDKELKQKVFEYPEKYFVLIDIRLSEYDSSDIKGLPDFKEGKETIEWKIPTWAKFTALENSDGFLFFDEINLTTPIVMGSCYKIIYDRVINEEKMSGNWLVLGAGNKESDRAYTHTIPSPLRDRGGEVELSVPDVDDWVDWGLKNGMDSRIIGFLNFKRSNLHPPTNFEDGQKFTTARGWERVNTLINKLPIGEIDLIVRSAIGEGVASEFVAFCKIQEKLNMEDLIKNPEKIKTITAIDIRYFLVSALADRYKDKKIKFDKIVEVSKVLDEAKGVEFVAILWRMCLGYAKDTFTKDFQSCKENDLIEKYSKYILK